MRFHRPVHISIIINVDLAEKPLIMLDLMTMTFLVRKQFEIAIRKLQHVREPKS